MATDHILFIHGVNTREQREQPTYPNQLIGHIKKLIDDPNNLKTIPLYWGDVNIESEQYLMSKVARPGSRWHELWFQNTRQNTILHFMGDAALYISRSVGSKIVEKLKEQVRKGLENASQSDRLHLVSHSWGTFILFDILFAARWKDSNILGHDSAMAIRGCFRGLEPNPDEGIRIASIHTMASPIAIFSLLDIVKGEDQAKGFSELTEKQAEQRASHDITPNLKQLVANSRDKPDSNKLPWLNYLHPADPIAWPLDPLIYSLVDGLKRNIEVQDIIIKLSFVESLMQPFSQTALVMLLYGGQAHESYLHSVQVAQKIVLTIQQTRNLGLGSRD
ncbi:hypothetical protein OGM63_20585 [Plectonema radiosum NIES-515]|uniref:AB hydrolase-1 domain-containing protein n=1 Tax=Plectonema radiosum NIES-515 TaxID=2986073 RepID=A0ABT3B3P8_9CYAN|nr:hypothetical protein [Plectonema radiosum]MCV3215875.1 hypothetical protein [Plectonema radiosum NIES-515]